MEKPLVTVLVTAYNSRYLTETIRSVDSQKYSPLELVVIDDGSNPPLKDTLPRMKDHELRYFFIEHKGFPHGLIRGMKEAKGKYVAILDHDDILTENSILSRANALENNPNAAFAYGDVVYINSSGKEYGRNNFKQYDDKNEFIKDVLLKPFGPITHTTVMFKKECIDAVGGYDEKNKRLFDTDLILKLAQRYSMIKLNEDVIKYRTHNFNASKSFEHKIKSIPYKLEAIDKYLKSDYNNWDYKAKVIFWQTLKAVYSLVSFARPKTLIALLK